MRPEVSLFIITNGCAAVDFGGSIELLVVVVFVVVVVAEVVVDMAGSAGLVVVRGEASAAALAPWARSDTTDAERVRLDELLGNMRNSINPPVSHTMTAAARTRRRPTSCVYVSH